MASSGATIGDILSDSADHSAANEAPVTALASAMMFGSITFAASSLAARSYLTGDMRAIRAAQKSKSKPLDMKSLESVYSLLHHLAVFGIILFYAYICEFHPPYPHSNKSYDRDQFFFLTTLLFVASAYTVVKNDKTRDDGSAPEYNSRVVQPVNETNDVLNRNQTEEWKGWMQYMFLLYHYYHAEEVYNSIRIMISSYVWMTGFGNFSFFYIKGDYGAVRILQMLWRLNFLVVFLCITQGTTYILYYICLLHTYYFLLVYAIMRISQHINYTTWGLRAKLGLLAVIILLVWDVDTGLFRLIHFPFLGETPMLGATNGSMWEWYFRSSLDHWSTFLGMVFALNFPITSLFYRKLEAQPLVWHVLAKAAVGLALAGAFYVWAVGPFRQSKYDYNNTNAYFGFIPIITYIYLRNLTPWLRSHSMELLHQIGKTTLETYLMQHHIWLTSNAKSLLTLIPGWPKVNMIVVTAIYFLISRRLYQLTLFLRGMILPNSKRKCFRNLAVFGMVLIAFYAMALSLQTFGIMSLTTIGCVSVICGFLLYQFIMDSTWERFKQSAFATREQSLEEVMLEKMVGNGAGSPKYDTPVNSMAAPLIGTMVIFIIGLLWHGMAEVGASKIGPLPSGCEAYVNDGVWIPINPCNDDAKGAGYRDYGISSFATCAANGNTFVWGWNETESASHCRFTYRDSKSIRKALNHRTVTFVGDSITRNVYHAMLRQMGMAGAGAYNTKVPKWSDITNTVGDTVMEFEWAPLVSDQLSKIRDIIRRPRQAAEKSPLRPHMVVMGGGPWDRLREYATDEDRQIHRASTKELSKEIRLARSAGMSVVWVVPTTINSKALLTEEKQKNIKEQDMAAMRAVYDKAGVLSSASFVLDGPSFTASRVRESHDGVHYPLSVYDAGAQILANAMDWVLLDFDISDPFTPPEPGSMANPSLGFMVLCFIFMGLICFDGFMGFSYLAAFFVRGIMPADLYDEAFEDLHDRKGLPTNDMSTIPKRSVTLEAATFGSASMSSVPRSAASRDRSHRSNASSRSNISARSNTSSRANDSSATGRSSASGRDASAASNTSGRSSAGSIDDEIAALLGTTSKVLDGN